MGTELIRGACVSEIGAAQKAVKDLQRSYRNYVAAKANVDAGAWGAGAGVITILGCAFAVTGVGAVVCVAGGGAAVISGGLWSASGIPSLEDAADAVSDALKKAEKAVHKACKCIEQNSVSTPDD
jgi:hypothetical protein